jgi:N-acetylneuraminic acid mutarotase
MPTARYAPATAVVNNTIYAIGGFNNGIALATVEAYDPVSNTWVAKAPMPTARYGLAAAAVNNTIYAIGGGDSNGNVLATVEAYTPATTLYVYTKN